jgi:hypothetical protein
MIAPTRERFQALLARQLGAEGMEAFLDGLQRMARSLVEDDGQVAPDERPPRDTDPGAPSRPATPSPVERDAL